MVVSDSERTHEAKATTINLQKILLLFIRFMYVSLALVVLPSAMTIFPIFLIIRPATLM